MHNRNMPIVELAEMTNSQEADVRWLLFDGQLKCLRLWGKVTFLGG